MKKYLLPNTGRFYKANLHCHTTLSDGHLSPEDVKVVYMQAGYSVVAYTDHNLLASHTELCDDDFVALNGVELEFSRSDWYENPVACHLCAIAPKRDELPLKAEYKLDTDSPNYVYDYTPENINRVIADARNRGMFVTYNHPTWSMENYTKYINYENMHAMEICNYGAVVGGFPEFNQRVYDDMLLSGKRIFCISADDNHNENPLDSPSSDSFGAFTVIKAEKLDYESITDALLKGNFYASQGPEIYKLWYENGFVNIECQEAAQIQFITGHCRCERAAARCGDGLNRASFKVEATDIYFRINVVDIHGNMAHTNAYFIDTLPLQE